MCGIVGYIGKKEAAPILFIGLSALEYRGYDSAGIAILNRKITHLREKGYVQKLKKQSATKKLHGTLGIGHTRWATHGEPSAKNAHPHYDCSKRVSVVHNGIIENFQVLKTYLQKKGHRFVSDTDTEVVAHLIEDFLRKSNDFKKALFNALEVIKGTYAFAILDAENKNAFYAARQSSPLVIGVGKSENYLASDPSALVHATKKVIYLKDGQVAEITRDKISITDLRRKPVPHDIEILEWDLEQAQKGNFPHFMLKEIYEGPDVVRASLSGRLRTKQKLIKLGGLEPVKDRLKNIKRIIILACGTSYYAGLVGEYLFEEITQIPTEVQLASEFRYRNEPFEKGTVALVISQSGETADTLGALRKAKKQGLLTLGIVNVVGSTIARETDAGVYNHAGPEIGVASTKAFLSQITVLSLIALYLTKKQTSIHHKLMLELETIPRKIQSILRQAPLLKVLAKKYRRFDNFLFLGRRYSYPVALEGALKLKEISYIHAEGYGAGEMKHGPIAMINPQFPTVAIVPSNSVSEKMYSNIQEIRARNGRVFAIATEGDAVISTLANDVFYTPRTLEPFEALLSVIPLQLFAYYAGVLKDFNVDKPRNLAKSVTVE